MGQKVNPIGMRLQVNRTWDSRWFAESKDYGNLLLEDLRMREFIHKDLKAAGISRVSIERPHKKCRVTIHTARPGVIIGKKGADIEGLRKKLSVFTKSELHLNIVEVRKPEVDAQLVAESIAQQMERRVSFRRAMKRGVQNAMRLGALGIRVNVAGRLGGAEIAGHGMGQQMAGMAGETVERLAPEIGRTRCNHRQSIRRFLGRSRRVQPLHSRETHVGTSPLT